MRHDLQKEDPELAVFLDGASAPIASTSLKQRILDDYEAAAYQSASRVSLGASYFGLGDVLSQLVQLFGGRPYAPAGIAAAIAIGGFFVGIAANPQSEEALYYADAALGGAIASVEEGFLWAVD